MTFSPQAPVRTPQQRAGMQSIYARCPMSDACCTLRFCTLTQAVTRRRTPSKPFVIMLAAAMDESTVQNWAVRRDRQAKAGVAVTALPASPKAGGTPFGGSQLCFALTEEGLFCRNSNYARQWLSGVISCCTLCLPKQPSLLSLLPACIRHGLSLLHLVI